MSGFPQALIVLAALAAASCAASGKDVSIYRETKLLGSHEDERPTSLVVDAKQRAILSAPTRGDDPRQKAIICAEPSPDALSTISSYFAASAAISGDPKTRDVNAAVARGVTETAGELARAAPVQILRDSMYRACEAYMNGALSREDYATISRRSADVAVAMMALQQMGQFAGQEGRLTLSAPQQNVTATSTTSRTTSEPTTPANAAARQGATQQTTSTTNQRANAKFVNDPRFGDADPLVLIAGDAAQQGDASVQTDAGERKPPLSDTFAGNMRLIVSDFLAAEDISNEHSLKSRCLSYFDRPAKAVGDNETSGDYYVRKGLLTLLCLDYFPAMRDFMFPNPENQHPGAADLDAARTIKQFTVEAMEELVRSSSEVQAKAVREQGSLASEPTSSTSSASQRRREREELKRQQEINY